MASHVLDIQFTWENEGTFNMKRQLDGGTIFTIIEAEEQGTLAELWPYIKDICKKQFDRELTEIGTQMKA